MIYVLNSGKYSIIFVNMLLKKVDLKSIINKFQGVSKRRTLCYSNMIRPAAYTSILKLAALSRPFALTKTPRLCKPTTNKPLK